MRNSIFFFIFCRRKRFKAQSILELSVAFKLCSNNECSTSLLNKYNLWDACGVCIWGYLKCVCVVCGV